MSTENEAKETEKAQQEEVINQEAEKESKDTAETTEPALSPLEVSENESKEWKDKYLRLYAEFDNFRKRNAKERIDLIKSASSDLLKDIIPALDDFDRAISANATNDDIDAVKEGFELIRGKTFRVLEGKGLVAMDSIGKPYDVEHHEAITNIPAPSEDMKNNVVDVIEKGYFLNDKVLRFAKVVVGQ